MNLSAHPQAPFHHAQINQDSSCISVAHAGGFSIFNLSPFGRCYHNGEASTLMCEMLFTTSLVAIVRLQESPRKLIILNTKRNTVICELNFSTRILCMKLNRRRLVVLLEESVHFYNIGNMKCVNIISTLPNPHGICALSPSSDQCWYSIPSGQGNALIYNAETGVHDSFIPAHKSPISAMAFGYRGDALATASDKGTVIRVWSIPSGQCMHQFRRGTLQAHITCMSFSLDSRLLAVSSETETVHLFRLDGGTSGDAVSPGVGGSPVLGARGPASPRIGGWGPGSPEFDAPDAEGEGGASPRLTTTISQGVLSAGRMAAAALIPASLITMFEPTRNYSLARIPGVASGNGHASSPTAADAPNLPNLTLCCITQEGATDRYTLFVITSHGILYEYAVQEGECRVIRQHALTGLCASSPPASLSVAGPPPIADGTGSRLGAVGQAT